MKRKLLFALLLTPALAHSTCYTLLDAKGDLIYSSTTPPFDLSGPPDSPAYAAAKAKGQRLVIQNACYRQSTNSPVEIVQRLGNQYEKGVAAQVLKMQEADRQQAEREQFVEDADRELFRHAQIGVKKLKFQNDVEEKMWGR